jgi:thiol:disulfide interchange protein
MLAAILAAFAGGVILNFMPCVFPIVSLKALGLVRREGHSARQEGLAFFAGVVVTMLALASVLLAARAGGAALGWGFQLQSPLLVAVLALVMLASALNLAGLFEVGLSLQQAAQAPQAKGAIARAALTGALAIVVATPCTGPFMAGAVGYALVQPPAVALAVFAALAVGFAAPFTVVSLVPATARWLPRPGGWMGTLKQVLAFPMLGAAAWLAWVLDRQAGAAALGVLLGCGVVLGFAAWLYGIGQRRRLMGHGYKAALTFAALAFVLLVPGLAGLNRAVATPTIPTERLAWSPQQVAQLRGKGRTIFVDFTASWCLTCQVNERVALSTPAVKQALNGSITMIADSSRYNPEIESAIDQFGRGGLPLYVIYPAKGGDPIILPQILTPAIVIAALNRANA